VTAYKRRIVSGRRLHIPADVRKELDLADGNGLSVELVAEAFNRQLAIEAGLRRASTPSAGLSSGDRACLTLTRSLNSTALTADPAWDKLDIGISVEFAR